jgi:succinate dehydrogenase / fumarate reductase membrane anchor subunit
MIAWFFYSNSLVEYSNWVSLFSNLYFKVFTVVFLISLIQHAWIGVWIIATDYISSAGCRMAFLGAAKLLAIGYLVWGIYILFFNY